MKISEKVAYLKGLIEGLSPEDNDTTKLIRSIVDVLEDMADAIRDIDETVNDLDEYVGELDEDLQEVEDYLEDEWDCDECDGCDDDDYFTIICPNCDEEFCVDEDIIEEGKINCPNCGETLEFDLVDEEPEEEKAEAEEPAPTEENE